MQTIEQGKKMKKYTADEGKVWKKDGKILGNILYTPDNFSEIELEQVDKPLEEFFEHIQFSL